MGKLSYDDRKILRDEINKWAGENLDTHDYEFVIYPETRASFRDAIKASAILTVPPKATDEDKVTKITFILRADDEIISWEQRAML